jgi:hypothetical protein
MMPGPRAVTCLLGVVLAAAGGAISADLYKWLDEKGVVTYGEKPPPNTRATLVNANPGAVIESGGQSTSRSEGGKQLMGDGPQNRASTAMPAPPAGSRPAAARGMEFDVYIRLQPGMTEGELLQRAGKPDHESVESFHRFIVKTYYYFPTTSNPYTTVVTLRGGRIQEVERLKKF